MGNMRSRFQETICLELSCKNTVLEKRKTNTVQSSQRKEKVKGFYFRYLSLIKEMLETLQSCFVLLALLYFSGLISQEFLKCIRKYIFRQIHCFFWRAIFIASHIFIITHWSLLFTNLLGNYIHIFSFSFSSPSPCSSSFSSFYLFIYFLVLEIRTQGSCTC